MNGCGNTDGASLGLMGVGILVRMVVGSEISPHPVHLQGHWGEKVSSQKASTACYSSHVYLRTKELGV